MKTVINYLLTITLAILIISIILLYIANNTILSSDYILTKLEKNNYYNEIYELVESNFEKYIYQSGLEETVIKNIVTKEKIQNDTKNIIENIYYNKNIEIDTSEIKNVLYNNIKETTKNYNMTSQEEAINTFIEHICSEYKISISYYNVTTKIGTSFTNVIKILDTAKITLLVIISIDFLLLFVINFKRMFSFVSCIGIAFTINGFFLLGTRMFIKSKIKINTITLLNDVISRIIRNIFNDILKCITISGIVIALAGIVFIIIASILKNKKQMKTK